MRRSLLLLSALLVLGWAAPARAQLFNYFNVVQGQRAFGLGGAYCALSADPSGWYYNPAGPIEADYDSFSLSGRALESKLVEISDYSGGERLRLGSLNFYPTGGAAIRRLGPGVIGFSTLVASNENIDADLTLSNASWQGEPAEVNLDLRQAQRTYLLGPGYSIRVAEHVSLGLSLFYFYDRKEANSATYVDYDAGGYDDRVFQLKTTNHGLVPHLGAQFRPFEWWRIGICLRQGLPLYRSGFTKVVTHTDHLQRSGRSKIVNSLKAETAFPFTVVLGTAMMPRPWITLSLDLSYFAAQNLLTLATGTQQPGNAALLQVINYNAGMEFLIRERYTVAAGAYTNRSAAPDPYELADTGILKVHWIGLTMQGGYRTNRTYTSLGLLLNLGNGDTVNPAGDKVAVNGISTSIVLGTSYWFD
ncbi:MAG: hypothetical protein P9M14_01770 [Candidatus Alcyoniella australis]|nr:hypothetical protein [Candidatus Alcyoniella australis]